MNDEDDKREWQQVRSTRDSFPDMFWLNFIFIWVPLVVECSCHVQEFCDANITKFDASVRRQTVLCRTKLTVVGQRGLINLSFC